MGFDEETVASLQVELADLRARVDVPVWRDPKNVLAVLAFAVSLFTAGYSIYTEQIKDTHDLQSDLATATEKLAGLPLSRADFLLKRANVPRTTTGYLGAADINDSFQNETAMFAFEGYHLALKLGSSSATPELLEISNALGKINNFPKAVTVLNLALRNADNWYDEISTRNLLERELLSLPTKARSRDEAQKVFDGESSIGARYPALGNDPALLAYELADARLKWGEALQALGCGYAAPQMTQALAEYAKSGFGPPDALEQDENYIATCAGKQMPPAQATPPH